MINNNQNNEKPKIGFETITFPERDAEKPDFLDTVTAVVKNNDFVNIAKAVPKAFQSNPLANYATPDEGFDYYDEKHYAGIPAAYWDKVSEAAATGSQKEVDLERQRIQSELADLDTINRAGFTGGALSFASGVISPTYFLPVGAAAKYATFGKGFASGIKQILPSAIVGSMISNTAESINHETRGAEDWIKQTFMDSLFSTGIGAIVGAKRMYDARVIQKAQGAIESIYDDIKIDVKAGPNGEFKGYKASAISDSVGAARVEQVQSFLDNGIATVGENKYFQLAFHASPTVRGMTNPFNAVRQLTNRLFKPNLVTGAIEKGNIETLPCAHDIYMDYKSLSDAAQSSVKDLWTKYAGIDSGVFKGTRAWNEARKKGLLDQKSFREQVGIAMRNGDTHKIVEVQQAAELVRKRVYQPLFDHLVELGKLDKNIDVKTATSYLNRIWDKGLILERPEDFRKMCYKHFESVNNIRSQYLAPLETQESLLKILRRQLKEEGISSDRKKILKEKIKSEQASYDKKRAEIQKAIDDGLVPAKALNKVSELSSEQISELEALHEPIIKAEQELKEAKKAYKSLGTIKNLESFVDIEVSHVADEYIKKSLENVNKYGKKGAINELIREKNNIARIYKEKKQALKRSKEKLEEFKKQSQEKGEVSFSEKKGILKKSKKDYEEAKKQAKIRAKEEMIKAKNELKEIEEATKGHNKHIDDPELELFKQEYEAKKAYAKSGYLDEPELASLKKEYERNKKISEFAPESKELEHFKDKEYQEHKKEYQRNKETVETYNQERIARNLVLSELKQGISKGMTDKELTNLITQKKKAISGIKTKAKAGGKSRAKESRKSIEQAELKLEHEKSSLRKRLVNEEIDSELTFMDSKGNWRLREIGEKSWFRNHLSESEWDMVANNTMDTITELNDEQIAGRIFGELTGTGGKPGSLKERSFLIDDNDAQDFLINDINNLMDIYAGQLGKYIGLEEMYLKYGSNAKDGKNKIISTLKDEYNKKRAKIESEAKPENRAKELSNLKKEFDKSEKFMNDQFSIYMGNYVDQNSTIKRATNAFRSYNVATQMGGLLLTSLTDLTMPIFRFGFWEYMKDGVIPTIKNFKKLMIDKKAQRGDLRDAALACETALGGMLDERWGNGIHYQPKAAWERIPKNLASLQGNINFSNQFGDLMQTIVGQMSMSKTIRELEKFSTTGNLTQKQLERFGLLGIDPTAWARPILEQVKTHGEFVDGAWIANVSNWTDMKAAQAFRVAMRREMKATISVQSPLDVPLAFRKPVLDCITQYMSWGFGATTNLVIPMLQRPDAEKLSGIFALMSLGAFIGPLRQLASGREVDMSPKSLLGGAIFDSGVMGHNGDILSKLNSVLRIPYLEQLKQDKYRMKTPIQILGGPLGGTMETAQRMVNMFLNGEINQNDLSRTIKLLPYIDNILLRRPIGAMIRNSSLPETAAEARSLKE